MRHVIGDLPVGFHQLLNAVEHGVEVLGELVPLIAASAQGNALAEPGSHDFSGGGIDCFDPSHRAPRGGYARCRRREDDQPESPSKTGGNCVDKAAEILNFSSDEEMVATG